MEPVDLEQLVDDALKRLPAPRAPRTLLARVMAAVEERAMVPWYARPWLAWPHLWQGVSGFAAATFVFGLARLWANTQVARDTLIDRVVPQVPGALTDVAARTAAMLDAARIAWRVVAEPVLLPVLIFMCVMTAACIVCAVALNRVALGGASES